MTTVGYPTDLLVKQCHGVNMKTLTDHLSQYAKYHRDRRNIATHFVGIPMITFGVVAFLSRPVFMVGSFALSPALLVVLGGLAFYLRLDRRYGFAMAAELALFMWGASALAASSTTVWLSGATGFFVLGWVIQFIGHYFEGKKPAFVDDIVGLLVGPLFVMAEWGFILGMRREVQHDIEAIAGKTLIRTRGAVVS